MNYAKVLHVPSIWPCPTKNESPNLGMKYSPRDSICIALLFSLLGAFFWAIRGTGGYGGEDGGALAGLGWAMVWFGLSWFDGKGGHRPYASNAIIVAITLGIMIGGFTGYGVYNGWVRGNFYLDHPHGEREVAAWTGYTMLFLCGLHWGGIPGAFMAWCAPEKPATWTTWIVRLVAGVAGIVVSLWIVRQFPAWFLPFYGEGIYQVEANATCVRAQDSLHTIAPHVGLYLGWLVLEIVRRDKRAIAIMLIMGLGFALPFAIGGYWHTMNATEWRMPWWKFWEMTIGFGGGLAFALAFLLFNRPDPDQKYDPAKGVRWAWIIIVVAGGFVLTGAVDGFTRLHEIARPAWLSRGAIAYAYLIAAAIALGLYARRISMRKFDMRPVPLAVVWLVLGVIFAAGFVVSVPGEWVLTNYVLLSIYTVSLTVSLVAFGVLQSGRRKDAVPTGKKS